MKIDEKAIRKLADLLEETGLSEIEVAEGEQMIRVNKGGMLSAGGRSFTPSHAVMASDPAVPQPANTQSPAATVSEHPGAVTSPMVGTAYMQPGPDKPPFVAKGTSVTEGDTLLIIEAMKVMNPIDRSHRSSGLFLILPSRTFSCHIVAASAACFWIRGAGSCGVAAGAGACVVPVDAEAKLPAISIDRPAGCPPERSRETRF